MQERRARHPGALRRPQVGQENPFAWLLRDAAPEGGRGGGGTSPVQTAHLWQSDKICCLGADRRASGQAWRSGPAHQPRGMPCRAAHQIGLRRDDADRAHPDGALLEVGVLDLDGGDPVVIHAMPLRQKFRRFLG